MTETSLCHSMAVILLDAGGNLGIGISETGIALFFAVIIYQLAWDFPWAPGTFFLATFWLLLGIGRLVRSGVIVVTLFTGKEKELGCILLLIADLITAACAVGFAVAFFSTTTSMMVWFHGEQQKRGVSPDAG